MNGRAANPTPAQMQRYGQVIKAVVLTLEEMEATDRNMLGNVSTYLLQWAVNGLTHDQAASAIDDYVDHVRELVNG